jgi:hypothetical protein
METLDMGHFFWRPHHTPPLPCRTIISYLILLRNIKAVCQPEDSDTEHCQGQLVTEVESRG